MAALRKIAIIPVIGAMFLLCIVLSCAATAGARKDSLESQLRGRVEAYWDAKVAGRYEDAYEYEEPLFRKGISLASYLRRRGAAGKWDKASVESIDMKGEEAQVKLGLAVRFMVPGAKQTATEIKHSERWVFVDSEWFHSPERMR